MFVRHFYQRRLAEGLKAARPESDEKKAAYITKNAPKFPIR